MSNERIITNGSQAMEDVAEHYASELDAQFRTLNHFANHAGEIGRAHENFLRAILKKFLPDSIKLSSGFVAAPKWTSRQQNILIHKSGFSTLFTLGDCSVIDHHSFFGTIEVKTDISSSQAFIEALEKQAELKKQIGRGMHTIYAWDAISKEKSLDSVWEFVRLNPTKNYGLLPNAIYVRGKYLLIANSDGRRDSPPFHLWNIGEDGIKEGQALLGIVSSIWKFGQSLVLPWWLLSWHEHLGIAAGMHEKVPWPDDLKISVMADL